MKEKEKIDLTFFVCCITCSQFGLTITALMTPPHVGTSEVPPFIRKPWICFSGFMV